jgi:hypothetical protein
MALNRKDRLPHATPPIKFLTENGFSIVRLLEIDPSMIDSPAECRFLVQHEGRAKHKVAVALDDKVVTSLQLRRQIPLSEHSLFWVVCIESCLATDLWEKNDYPPNDRMIISELPPDELMLALHWQEPQLTKCSKP